MFAFRFLIGFLNISFLLLVGFHSEPCRGLLSAARSISISAVLAATATAAGLVGLGLEVLVAGLVMAMGQFLWL